MHTVSHAVIPIGRTILSSALDTSPDTKSTSPDLKRFIRLRGYLDANEIDWETYLVNLLEGLAPPPIVFGGVLYLDRSDERAFRSRLRLESLQRAADLAWQANVDRVEAIDKDSDPRAPGNRFKESVCVS